MLLEIATVEEEVFKKVEFEISSGHVLEYATQIGVYDRSPSSINLEYEILCDLSGLAAYTNGTRLN